jgi:hypothetical protein
MVAMDVLEFSPKTKRGNRNFISDMFSRYVVAVPIYDESADTVARVFFDRCVLVGVCVRVVFATADGFGS